MYAYVCMYVCMYVVRTYKRIYVLYVCVGAFVILYICILLCTYVCKYVCMYVRYVYLCLCIFEFQLMNFVCDCSTRMLCPVAGGYVRLADGTVGPPHGLQNVL